MSDDWPEIKMSAKKTYPLKYKCEDAMSKCFYHDRCICHEKLAADLALKCELVEALKEEHGEIFCDPKDCDVHALITRAEKRHE